MSITVRNVAVTEILKWLLTALSLFRRRWWLWVPMMMLSFAPIFAISALQLDPFVGKATTFMFGALGGIVPIVYGVAQWQSRRVLDVLAGNIGALVGVAIATTVLNLFVWKFVELPVLRLVANADELLGYSGDFSKSELTRPRVWVDGIHTFIVMFFASPIVLASAVVLLRKVGALAALSASARAFAVNSLTFVALALVMTVLHAFVDEPMWLFAMHAVFFLFVVAPVYMILSIIMANDMCGAQSS